MGYRHPSVVGAGPDAGPGGGPEAETPSVIETPSNIYFQVKHAILAPDLCLGQWPRLGSMRLEALAVRCDATQCGLAPSCCIGGCIALELSRPGDDFNRKRVLT